MIERVAKNVSRESEVLFLRKTSLPDREHPELTGRITEFGWSVYVRYEEAYVRCALAKRDDCTFRNAMLLSMDVDPAVRAEVVNNKTTPAVLIKSIAKMELARPANEISWVVLQALAYRSGLPTQIYRALYNLGHWYILIGLAHNASCPTDTLEAIAELPVVIEGTNKQYAGYDKNKELREIAHKRLARIK